MEMAIALLLLHPLAGPYETTLMSGIPLIRSTLRSLGCGGRPRHATLLTQAPSESAVGAGDAAAGPGGGANAALSAGWGDGESDEAESAMCLM